MSERFHTILLFLQARNISVKIEFRDSDDENAKPLKVSVIFSVKFHLQLSLEISCYSAVFL